MKESEKSCRRNPDIPYIDMSSLRRIRGERFSFEYLKIDGQSFYSIIWEDGA